jgi:hypothetical protein
VVETGRGVVGTGLLLGVGLVEGPDRTSLLAQLLPGSSFLPVVEPSQQPNRVFAHPPTIGSVAGSVVDMGVGCGVGAGVVGAIGTGVDVSEDSVVRVLVDVLLEVLVAEVVLVVVLVVEVVEVVEDVDDEVLVFVLELGAGVAVVVKTASSVIAP